MGSSKKVTTGYRYYMGLHFGLCHGPVDSVEQVLCGDRLAWIGEQTASGAIAISAGSLFGGDEREGGIAGTLDIEMGEPAQGQNDYLVSKINANIPAFRGILSAIWRGGQVSSNNPYVKPWAFRVKRIAEGWAGGSAWLPAKAPIPFIEPINGDATVKLLTRFIDASSNDMSQYALGEGVTTNPTGVTLSTGNVRFGVISNPSWSGITGIGWTDSELVAIDDQEMTWEFIFSASVQTTTSSQAQQIIAIDLGNGQTDLYRWIYIQINGGFGGETPVNHHKLVVQLKLNQPIFTSSAPVTIEYGVSSFHIAIQRQADRSIQVFFEGERVVLGEEWASTTSDSATSGVVIIGTTPYDPTWDIKCYALRVSTRLVYTGATYTIPTAEDLTADFDTVTSGLVGMNPAHIIYQCLTDTAWGMGYPTSAIDDDSFTDAANALFDEGFGLSMLWNRQETIENFIQIVLDHIGGLLYVRPDTGTFALKLIRSDYVRASLPLYGPSTLVSAENYQRQAWGETINEMTAVYIDYTTGKDTTVTAQDMANVQIQGGIVSQTRNYPGINWPPLAQRVTLRDLQTTSTPLARIKLTATRAAWQVFPGDVFRLTWPKYSIDDVVYRVLAVNRGTLQDGQIIIDAVEDVFGLPDNTYLVEQPSEWEDPSNPPAEAPYRKMLEAPYWDLARTLSAADLDYVDALSGYLETAAVRPSGDATNYNIYAKIGAAEYAEEGNGDFCPSATVVEALTKTTTAITLASGVDLDLVTAGGYAIIGDEYVLISAIDAGALTATISRGVLDTVPVAHTAGSRIWFADGYVGFSTTEYADTEALDVKLLPITGQGMLEITTAPSDSITFDQRQYRPYPPAGLLFDGLAWPATLDGGADVVLTWAHRDRTLQTAYIVEQDEASIGPEASVTYSLEVADESLAVLHSETGITDDTATVPASALVTEELLRFRLWAVRGGLVSWQTHEHFVTYGNARATESGDTRITEAGATRNTD